MLDWFFAQALPPTPTFSQDVAPWASILGSGFVGTLLWYLITVQLPRMVKEFTEEIKSARTDHAAEIKSARADYIEQAKLERELFQEQSLHERTGCDKRHQELIEKSDTRHAELLEKLQVSHEVLREVKHEVANLAHSRAMERAANEMKAKQAPTKEPRP